MPLPRFPFPAVATVFLLYSACAACAHADTLPPSPQSPWSLDLSLASWHTRAWARKTLNQINPGIGVEYQWSSDWGALGGFYRNSYRKPTLYALAAWTPLHFSLPAGAGISASAGFAAGMVSGYTRPEVATEPLAGGVVLRIRGRSGVGLNFLAVPNTVSGSGFVGVQFVLPLP